MEELLASPDSWSGWKSVESENPTCGDSPSHDDMHQILLTFPRRKWFWGNLSIWTEINSGRKGHLRGVCECARQGVTVEGTNYEAFKNVSFIRPERRKNPRKDCNQNHTRNHEHRKSESTEAIICSFWLHAAFAFNYSRNQIKIHKEIF